MLTSIKRQAQSLKTLANLKLSESQELLARSYRYANFHEFSQGIQSNPGDERLLGATLNPLSYPGTADNWSRIFIRQIDVFSERLNLTKGEAANLVARIHGFQDRDSVFYTSADDLISTHRPAIDRDLSNIMSGPIAETNASSYSIDEYFIERVVPDYDYERCHILLSVNYTGEQAPESPWCGSKFDLTLRCDFKRSSRSWVLEEIDLENYTSDFDTLTESDLDQSEAGDITPVMTRDDICSVMKEHPELTHFGIGACRHTGQTYKEYLERFEKDRQTLMESVDECNRALFFLAHTTKRQTLNRSFTSYGLKHSVENFLRYTGGFENKYLSNGAFICAAIHYGYNYSPSDNRGSPNAIFNISSTSPVLMWLRLYGRGANNLSRAETKKLHVLEEQLEIAPEYRIASLKERRV